MIIHKGDKTLKVTMGTYKSIFKSQGWSVEDPDKAKSFGMKLPDPDKENTPPDENPHEVEDSSEDLSERPLSDLSLEELRSLASQYGINTDGMRLKRDIRSAIRDAMSNAE